MTGEVRRARLLLGAGAALGIALAARGVLRPARAAGALPESAVALVGETPITAAEYARAVAAVESDRRDHRADPALRRHVLERLVDEELLVQRAVELGLPTREPRLRGQIAAAMIDGVMGGPAPAPPGEDALRAFHAARPELFSRRGRVAVEILFFAGAPAPAAARAGAARARLEAGEPFAAIAALADPPPAPLPRGPLPEAKLAEYAGPAVARTALALRPGSTSEPVPVDGGAYLVRVLDREGGEITGYDDARADVLAEWQREQDDVRLRRWLDGRRAATRVLVREPLP